MKLKRFTMMIAVFALCCLTSAQNYAIRVASNTNLRASNSLDARIVETAPAGTTLHVIGAVNRWLKISYNGGEAWMADWVGYSRVEASAPAQSQTQSSAPDIDNCCFVDRQCHSDQDWMDGYWAFQNGQCAAPAVTQTRTSQQPEPSQADNCCYLNWNCMSDDDWSAGFNAFRSQQCAHRGLVIEGSEAFVAKIGQALDMLERRAPGWYDYAIRGLDKIKEVPASVYTGAHVADRTFNISPAHTVDRQGDRTAVWLAGIIVHDACHVHQFEAGLPYSHLEGERECLEIQLEALALIYPKARDPFGLRVVLENIENPDYQWWLD